MDRLSQHVKAGMLKCPSIFPTRLAVLSHTFLVLGNGLEWVNHNAGAEMTDRHSSRDLNEKMRYDDLDERVEKWTIRVDSPNASDIACNASIIKTTEEDRRARQDRERNIDMLASTPSHDTLPGNGHYDVARNVIGYIQSGYLAFGTWPGKKDKKVEASFFAGALEILDAVIRSTVDDDAAKDALQAFRDGLTPNFSPTIPKLAPLPPKVTEAALTITLSKDVNPAAIRAVLAVFDGASVEEAMAQFTASKNPGIRAAREHESVRAAVASGDFVPTHGISLREINCQVTVLKNGSRVRAFDEYRAAAEYIQNTYGLSDADLYAIYDDYKEDYDKQ